MKSRAIFITILLLLTASIAGGQNLKSKVAPDFTLPDIENNRVTLSETYGNGPIYISFWATWCKPCREELKIIQGLYEKYKDDGFRVLAINTEGPRAISKIKSFAKSNGWTFDILIDSGGEVFRRKYKGFAQPYSVMTDPQGNIIFSAIGFKPGDEKHVEGLIIENIPSAEKDESESGSEE
ncbi:MAG: TlpA disulfide reductase family protein [candidate division Zixibacteria bacterium]